jgi:hypothetical protein
MRHDVNRLVNRYHMDMSPCVGKCSQSQPQPLAHGLELATPQQPLKAALQKESHDAILESTGGSVRVDTLG